MQFLNYAQLEVVLLFLDHPIHLIAAHALICPIEFMRKNQERGNK